MFGDELGARHNIVIQQQGNCAARLGQTAIAGSRNTLSGLLDILNRQTIFEGIDDC